MMSKVVMSNSVESKRFIEAVDLFFGMNPTRKFWILFMFYLAKERVLRIVENIDPKEFEQSQPYYEGYWHNMVSLSEYDLQNSTLEEEWRNKGITNRFVWADTPKGIENFDEIVYSIDVEAHDSMDGNKDENIFNRKRWEPIYLMTVAETFIALSDEWYKENSSWALDLIIRRLQGQDGKRRSIYSQPKEITEFVGRLLNATEGDMYNPYAGLCSYSTIQRNSVRYYAQEIDFISHIFGKLRVHVERRDNFICECGNSISDWKASSSQFNYIVATPPFGQKLREHTYGTAELDYLARSSNDAKKKSIGVYPASICYDSNSESTQIITNLVNHDWIETVVLLPRNIFPHTAIETVVIVVNKEKDRKGEICIVDASDCFYKEGRYNVLDVEKIFSRLQSDKQELGVRWITNEAYHQHDSKIYPKFYTSVDKNPIPEGYKVVELREIVEEYPRLRGTECVKGYLVKVPNLSTSVLECIKEPSDFKRSDDVSHTIKVVEPVLLISKVGEIRPTYCNASLDEPLFVSHNIAIFKIKSDKSWVNPRYLCYELSRRVKSDIGIRPGYLAGIFVRTRLAFPSFNYEEQDRIVRDAIFQSKFAQAREMGLLEIIDSMKTEYINEVKIRKHDMQAYLRELGSVERMMRRYVEKSQEMPDFKSKMYNLLNQYHLAFKNLSDLVDIFSEEEKFGNAEPFNIDQYFIELVKGHNAETAGYEIIYEKDTDALVELGLHSHNSYSKGSSILNGAISIKIERLDDAEPLYVDISPIDFQRLVKNIVDNACMHGFTEPNESTYEFEIDLSVDAERRMYQIDFINNGTPLPSGLDKVRYGIRGEKAGLTGRSGKGGYIVRTIVEHYNGDYDVFMDNEKTVVRIFLPISKNKDEQDV